MLANVNMWTFLTVQACKYTQVSKARFQVRFNHPLITFQNHNVSA